MQELTANSGQGHHSQGVAKLKPAVKTSAKKKYIKHQLSPKNPSRIRFVLRKGKTSLNMMTIAPKNLEPETKTQISIEIPYDRRIAYATA
jgi:hypothetical protein